MTPSVKIYYKKIRFAGHTNGYYNEDNCNICNISFGTD